MQLKRCCASVVVMSVQANAESEINKPVDDARVHVVMCTWPTYHSMVPHGNGYRGL